MMTYALVHYPDIDIPSIEQFRNKYDPQVDLIAPHITLMFPLSDSIGENDLVRHLESVLAGWQPFSIHLQGIQVSSDGYLFLTIQDGYAKLVRLHDQIYTGILAGYLKKDLPYIPHLTLGVLDKDSNKNASVLREARQLEIDHPCVLNKLHIIKVNNVRSKIVWYKEFPLPG